MPYDDGVLPTPTHHRYALTRLTAGWRRRGTAVTFACALVTPYPTLTPPSSHLPLSIPTRRPSIYPSKPLPFLPYLGLRLDG